mmetsp:Transcript_67872/g.136573  ORF Transcript_67872/g.136573 Transcript_67872/m.136573 type:complete len:639 (+) Transcript_67872:157-2073(+)|eukprot:CAMPEP_0171717584 /NCGR_PEP_ID=MMETSP0991-20121206/20113_1 /TAXON_ID=483369 /ORGANISM="non described non described, Strain CCMP2098" /LENGTH=638 /DNA_ID=CAMNT_0012308815 /DNA_START=120 /DNA_END=2036 /DNA_ORIENTATION=-
MISIILGISILFPAQSFQIRSHIFIRHLVARVSHRHANPSTDKFHKWLESNGAIFDKVRVGVAPEGGGLGVFATEAVEDGENVLDLPLGACIVDFENDSTGLSSFDTTPVAKRLEIASRNELSWTTRMGVSLLYEKSIGPLSRFAPYLALLSSDPPPHLPHRFTDSTLISEGQSFAFEARVDANFFRSYTLREELFDVYESALIREGLESGDVEREMRALDKEIPTDVFRWAVDTIQSRTFLFKVPDEEQLSLPSSIRVLAPMYDCFNHNCKASSRFDFQCGSFSYSNGSGSDCAGGDITRKENEARKNLQTTMTTMTNPDQGSFDGYRVIEKETGPRLRLSVDAHAKGEQVLINYGSKPSDDFALFYGFLPQPLGANPHAAVQVVGGLTPAQLRDFESNVVKRAREADQPAPSLSSSSFRSSSRFQESIDELLTQLSDRSVLDCELSLSLHPDDLSDGLETLVSVAAAMANAEAAVVAKEKKESRKKIAAQATRSKIIAHSFSVDVNGQATKELDLDSSVASAAKLLADRMAWELALYPTTLAADMDALAMLQTNSGSEADENSMVPLQMMMQLRVEKKTVLCELEGLFRMLVCNPGELDSAVQESLDELDIEASLLRYLQVKLPLLLKAPSLLQIP